MKRSDLSRVLLVLALIIASCQCTIACAVQPCHEGTPSQASGKPPATCHQHQQSKQKQGTEKCLHTIFVMALWSPPASDTPDFAALDVRPALPSEIQAFCNLESQWSPLPDAASPPHSAELVLSTVLRV